MITAYVVGGTEVAARLDRLPEMYRAELAKGIGVLAIKLYKNVVRDKLSGQVLGVKTGRLRRSIKEKVFDEGDSVVGVVSTKLIYGIGWETGWADYTPRASIAKAKSKFKPGGDATTFKNGKPRKRSFLASALRDLEESGLIRQEIDKAIGTVTL